jgi:glutathione S-transferase
MSTYRLTFFNHIRTRAEVIRLIFAQAGVEYEDKRIEKEGPKKEWVQLKPSTPSGVLPVLEVDGKQLTGSVVIQRFLAERFGLAGSNDVENAEIAGICDVLNDFLTCIVKARFESDEERKTQLDKKLSKEDIPKYMGIIERMAKKNNSADGWVYGKKPTYADLTVFHILEYILIIDPTVIKDFPHVAKIKASVEALPKVAAWLEKRPVTNDY